MKNLQDYLENLYTCARTQCSFCVYECPVRKVLGFETYSSRGRMHVARALAQGLLEPCKEIAELYYKCTLCGYCEAVCALENTSIFRAVRKLLVSENIVPKEHLAARDSILTVDNPYSKDRKVKYSKTLPVKKSKTILYLGCTIPISRRQIVDALKYLLEKAFPEVGYLGEEEYCCGLILYESGFEKEFIEQAEKNIESFKKSGVEKIITVCPGCYIALKEHYAEYFNIDYEVYHITEYFYELVNSGELKLLKLGGEVVYHDPCHLTRHGKVVEEPRALLEWLGIEVKEAPVYNKYYARCCGGSILMFYPELASEIGVMRLNELLSTGVDTIVSACEICEIALDKATVKKGEFIEVLDVVELLAKALK
ncbi:MAG: hypothetical protein DRN04_08690 [Thermoprotei archaeon]|nr:MAG: hypothetical protein DRN04_08690 [Thermoprotei archaeon]